MGAPMDSRGASPSLAPRRRPRALRPGDTVALISPASPFFRGEFTAEQVLSQARDALGRLGLRTVVGRHALDEYGYLAGGDRDRAKDVMDAFVNPDVAGIVTMGGGYGTPRLLDLLDYDVIGANPKVFIGYSDVTALHNAIGQRAGLVTFHGPMGFELARIQRMLAADADEARRRAALAFTWEWFGQAFMSATPLGELPGRGPWQPAPLETVVPGRARGLLVGGNLSLLADTLGTPYEIDTEGKILLIEEVEEPPYRIDRMLTQLRLAGKLDEAAGFIVAEWIDCKPTNPNRPTLTLEQVLKDVLAPLGKPTASGLAAGHGPGRLTLPLGVPVTVDADRGRIVVETAGVTEA